MRPPVQVGEQRSESVVRLVRVVCSLDSLDDLEYTPRILEE